MTVEINGGNWTWRDPSNEIPDNAIIYGGNFSQHTPNTAIMVGKPLTIRGGNWLNVFIDPAWKVESGFLVGVNKSFCTNLHPELIEYGLKPCLEQCTHVIDSEEINIGNKIVVIYQYKDTLL